MKLDLSVTQSSAEIKADETLPYLAFTIQTILNYYLGHGIYRIGIKRIKSETGDCLITFSAWCPPKPFAFSCAAHISEMVNEGYIPIELKKQDIWTPADAESSPYIMGKTILELPAYSSANGTTMLNQAGLILNQNLQSLTWGLADMITSVFAEGADEYKWQASVYLCQSWFNLGFASPEDIKKFIDTPYDLNHLVGSMPRNIKGELN